MGESELEKHKDFHIIINGRKRTVEHREATFEEIVKLAYEHPPKGPNVVFTVTYHNGPHHNPEGSLLPGGRVKVKDGMVFDVTETDKS